MKREIITIADNGTVTVPHEARMSIAEIADLFGIFYQTTKNSIRAIQKSGVADGDYSMCCMVEGTKVSPEYYGVDMITALAFRINSPKSEIFRNWVIKKAVSKTARLQVPIIIQCNNKLFIC